MAYRDSTATTATATSVNATKPALLQTGDILLCYLLTDVGLNSPAPTITPPTGWALITGSNQGANSGAPDGFTSFVYWKLAGNVEPATYTFSISGAASQLIALVGCFSGRKPNPVFDSTNTHGTVNTTGNATPVTVSDTGVTANTNDDIVVFATGDITVGTDTWAFTPPTNYTERQDSQLSFDVATMATRDEVFSGVTGTLSLTLTRSAGTGTSGWGIFVIAIPAQFQPQLAQPVFIFPGVVKTGPLLVHAVIASIPTEDVTVDKWFEQYDNPVRKSLPIAAIAASLFFVPVVSQAETITVDKWVQPQSQPQNKISYRQTGGEARFEVPRTVLVTDWFQPVSTPVLRKPTQLLGGESRFELPRTILISDWFAEIRQPYFSKFRLIPFGEYRFEVPRTILLTDWYQPVSHPIQRIRQVNNGGETRTEVVAAGEIVTLDKWYQPISQPFFSTKTNSNFGEYRFEVPRTILVTDWYQPFSEPIRLKVKPIEGGDTRVEVVVVVPETITLDKWFQPTQQPYFKIHVQQGTWEFRVEIVEESGGGGGGVSVVVGGGSGGGRHHEHMSSQEDEKKFIDRLLQDDETIFAILQAFINAKRNNLF